MGNWYKSLKFEWQLVLVLLGLLAILLAVIAVLGVIAGDDPVRKSRPAPAGPIPHLEFEIKAQNDVSYLGCDRETMRVVFADSPSRADVARFVEANGDSWRGDLDELTVWAYGPDDNWRSTNTLGVYQFGISNCP